MSPLNGATTEFQMIVAQQPQGPEFGKASPLGLLIIIVLLIATALLIRSMNKRLKKLPKEFDADHPQPDQEFDEGTDPLEDTSSDAAPDEQRRSADT